MKEQIDIEDFDWGEFNFRNRNIDVLDTSLRDGLQGAEGRHPTYQEKEGFVELLPKIGVDAVDIAIPIAGGSHLKDAIRLAKMLPPEIQVACLTRTDAADIEAALELSDQAGRKIEVIVFIGASKIRRFVEEWKLPEMVRWMGDSVKLADKYGLIPTIATEHTTATEPGVINALYRAGLENGGKKVCVADTTGRANPISTYTLIHYFRHHVLGKEFSDVEIDWHGHNDRGMAIVNSMAALNAGAKRVHGTALGIGERAGNTAIEPLLMNLKLAGDSKRQDLTHLADFAEYSSEIFGVPIPPDYPGLGSKVGRTGSGIHASAMLKSELLGLEAGAPYSVVDQRWFGRKSDVVVGPLSGRANPIFASRRLGIEPTEAFITEALNFARTANRILDDSDLRNIADRVKRNGSENGSS